MPGRHPLQRAVMCRPDSQDLESGPRRIAQAAQQALS
jgi:hypothetical protein